VSTKYPILSKNGSNIGAKIEAKIIERKKNPLLILKNKNKTKRKYHNTDVFGKKPKSIPNEKACANSPGCELAFRAFSILTKYLSIKILLYFKSFS